MEKIWLPLILSLSLFSLISHPPPKTCLILLTIFTTLIYLVLANNTNLPHLKVHTRLPKAKQYIAAVFVAPFQQALMENLEPPKHAPCCCIYIVIFELWSRECISLLESRPSSESISCWNCCNTQTYMPPGRHHSWSAAAAWGLIWTWLSSSLSPFPASNGLPFQLVLSDFPSSPPLSHWYPTPLDTGFVTCKGACNSSPKR